MEFEDWLKMFEEASFEQKQRFLIMILEIPLPIDIHAPWSSAMPVQETLKTKLGIK